ncbi:hypothetical protein SAMN05421538_102492 [Paracoccus isoporae]|uniref:Lipoprotein-attachment site-containing protein n=1 Tax=Paracoccus isoporae TaxID=591205 RepID=A0A1G6XUK8_9RHOB|nr:hypothetical protein [Paracoccus isoporae]SDD81393.1 hypothetical protein SAMN05421538_102492 [Paracoccus isoporae]
MTKHIALALIAVGVLAACQPRQPEITMPAAPAPVTQEPVYQGKYGAN